MQEIQIPPPELIETSKLTVHKTHLNPNKMTREQLDRLKTSIKKFGFIVPIITNKDLVIADGEQRWIVANELAMPKVLIVRLPVEEVDRLLIQQVMNSQAVRGMHDLLLDAMSFENIIDLGRKDDLKYLLNLKDEDLAQYLKKLHPTDTEETFDIPEIEKVKTDIKRGDVLDLGVHRLICGDSTSKEDVDKLMNGDKAILYLADPPYGVSYSEVRESTPIENDELNGAEFQQFLEKAFKALEPHLAENCAWYLWHAQKTQGYFTAAAAACSIIYHRQIVWVKPQLILGRGLYHWRHELCLMGWKKGSKPPFYGSRAQTTVWEYPAPRNASIHPTSKPIQVLLPAIQNHTQAGEIVVDNFGGSGSTLIACEQTGRVCYMMEIDPRYCEIIAQRWEKYTGLKRQIINKSSTNQADICQQESIPEHQKDKNKTD